MSTYFQKGFGLKAAVGPILAQSYDSGVVDRLKALGYAARAGDVVVKLAKEFGFCYGVDRAVEYAYQTRERFPDKQVYLSGEIIHNPDVNERMRQMGIAILPESKDAETRYAGIREGDVVILPAFGVTVGELASLRSKGCVLVDTTCGSVLNVWKNVHKYAREGFTAVIHGKHYHEETKATASQALTHPAGRYLCVRDLDEASFAADFIRGQHDDVAFLDRFRHAVSPGFVPGSDMERIGLANQTTMLMSESMKVQEILRQAMLERYGEAGLAERFRAFDTICSATQERQDAVLEMLEAGGLDLMIVIGGYNSSNTQALTRMCAAQLPTYHIDAPTCIESSSIRYRPVGEKEEKTKESFLPEGPARIGVTAGASTPNNVVGEVIQRLLAIRGLTADDLHT